MIETPRLILRQWLDSDRAPFAALNADSQVMEFMPNRLTRDESDALVDRIQADFKQHGFGLFAAELRETGEFLGFVGLAVPRFAAHFTPSVEIGWRLASRHWGKGYATEGALAAARHAFDDLGLDALVSFTASRNIRSRRVMEKIGMTHDDRDDFDHPSLEARHPLRRHVLYRLSKKLV